MQTLTVAIRIEGSALEEDTANEVARVFSTLAEDIRYHGHIAVIDGKVRDVNGNTVGTIEFTGD